MDITLIYLDNPFLRVKLARIPLFVGGISFGEKRISLKEFRSAKEVAFKKMVPSFLFIKYLALLLKEFQSLRLEQLQDSAENYLGYTEQRIGS